MAIAEHEEAEINEARGESSPTYRPTCAALEQIIHKPIHVLDHGFVRVVDYMGDDAAVVQAARVSYGRGTKKQSDDRGLIRYLMRNAHTSPFEMLELKLHVKLPIFVARQWVRHRTASINEYSARYSIVDSEFYMPDANHLAAQSTANKQGRTSVLPADEAAGVLDLLKRDAEQNYKDYIWLLNQAADGSPIDPDRSGLARELARMNLTLNIYTQWYWKIDVHNLLHFLQLRQDVHAQFEIREYANAIANIVKTWLPITYEAYSEYRRDSVTLAASSLAALKRIVRGERVTHATSGLARSEWKDLCGLLGIEE